MRTVLIELDRPRLLKIGSNAISMTEKLMGMGFGKIMSEEFSMSMLQTLLYAGLKWQDRSLTFERVGDLMDDYFEKGGTFEALAEKIGEAINKSGLFKSVKEDEFPNVEAEAETV